MARNTTPESYRHLVNLIREKIPEAAITTDIIVGFPGETEEEFSKSLEFVREMKFAGGHVFKYSPRDGTPASRLPGRVNGKIARERSQLMRNVLSQTEMKYREGFQNKSVAVLWESASSLGARGWKVHGLTDNYLLVTSWSATNLWNTISQVKIIEVNGEFLEGEILN